MTPEALLEQIRLIVREELRALNSPPTVETTSVSSYAKRKAAANLELARKYPEGVGK